MGRMTKKKNEESSHQILAIFKKRRNLILKKDFLLQSKLNIINEQLAH